MFPGISSFGLLAGCLLSLGHVLLHVLEFGWLFDDVFFPLQQHLELIKGQRPSSVEAGLQHLDPRLGQHGPPLWA